MFSYLSSENTKKSDIYNCTTASIFEKANSIKFELLFGAYKSKTSVSYNEDIINAYDYFFTPGQIFGFSYESTGVDYQKIHHAFILRACAPGEIGHSIFGISPGAKVLVSALTNATSLRLKSVITKIENNNIALPNIDVSKFEKLNTLLSVKIGTDYFLGELLEY